jgi:hypothetical protein
MAAETKPRPRALRRWLRKVRRVGGGPPESQPVPGLHTEPTMGRLRSGAEVVWSCESLSGCGCPVAGADAEDFTEQIFRPRPPCLKCQYGA